VSGGEQQQEEREQAHGDRPDGVRNPSGERSARKRSRVGDEGVQREGSTGFRERQRDAGQQEEPTEWVLWATGRDEDAQHGDADVHRDVEDVREAPCVPHLGQDRMSVEEREHQRGEHQRDRHDADRPRQPSSRRFAHATAPGAILPLSRSPRKSRSREGSTEPQEFCDSSFGCGGRMSHLERSA
jgi:hypothetical protein